MKKSKIINLSLLTGFLTSSIGFVTSISSVSCADNNTGNDAIKNTQIKVDSSKIYNALNKKITTDEWKNNTLIEKMIVSNFKSSLNSNSDKIVCKKNSIKKIEPDSENKNAMIKFQIIVKNGFQPNFLRTNGNVLYDAKTKFVTIRNLTLIRNITINPKLIFNVINQKFTNQEWVEQNNLTTAINNLLDKISGVNRGQINCTFYDWPTIPASDKSNEGVINFKINKQDNIILKIENKDNVTYDANNNIISVNKLNLKTFENNDKPENIYDELKSLSVPWYEQLTNAPWNKKNGNFENYFCNSEQQAIGLYSWCSGTFWNEPLHRGWQPKNISLPLWNLNLDYDVPHEIRGKDYELMSSGLQKSIFPKTMTLWHGVEFQEVEFYEQLKDFIVKLSDGSYDYKNCVGKEIVSNGFISTTLDKNYAINFFGWRPQYDWNTGLTEDNPLKEQVAFKININKGYRGAAYLSNFNFAGFGTSSHEHQVLIDRKCKFKINKVYVEQTQAGKVNIFDVDLIP